MDIQQLRYFVTVAEELHFAHAADRLHLTASPLSRRVRELERELGEDLFVRAYHKVELTRFGREFLPAALDVLRRFDALRDLARTPPQAVQPVREIGAAPLAHPIVLDRVFDAFERLYPDYKLPLTLEPSAVLLDKLSARELDLVVVHLPVTAPHLRSLALYRYGFGIAMRSDDALAGHARLHLTDVADRELLAMSPTIHPVALNGLRDVLRKRGVKHLTELSHNDTVRLATQILRTGALTLTALDPDLPLSRIFNAPGLTCVPLDEPDLHLAAGIAWRAEDEETDPILADVLGALRTHPAAA